MSYYLLDTNVISEMIKPSPNPAVMNWLKKIEITYFSLSVLSLGEIRKGIERLPDHDGKKQRITAWLEIDLLNQFSGRIFPIDEVVAQKWGYLSANVAVPAIDGLIAASALVHNQKLVTRNVADFEAIAGLEIINPWKI